jgi:potassium uptake TrkH family protein
MNVLCFCERDKKVKKRIKKFTTVQLIVLFYLLAVAVSVLLLSIPATHKEGVDLSFLDILFTSVSAISVTGLSVITVADSFNAYGVFILVFAIQFGGVGIMTMGTFLWLLTKRKIGLKERQLIMADQNQSDLSGLVNLMRQIIIIILSIEAIGIIVLGVHFMSYYDTWQEAFYHSTFASISATTNAGFDITGASMIPFKDDYFVQTITMLQVILGAIGFPVLVEVRTFFAQRKKRRYQFSLYTKLTTSIFFILVIFGFVSILLLEFNHFFADKTWHEMIFYSLFQSVTTKSSGLSTMDIHEFSNATLLIISILMFIGASPSSVGGGIRTTTIALNILFLYNFAKRNRTVKVFKRELHEDDILKSLVVTMMGGLLCFTSLFILTITEPFSLMELIFEVCSAFGTTGLSLGITPELSAVGKCVLMVLMFIGRIGIMTFIFLLSKEEQKTKYRYPKERVIIG